MNKNLKINRYNQKGVVFVISVIMLMVLAGLSVTILSSSVTEKVVSGSSQDSSVAKQAANDAVSTAKNNILDQWAVNETECSSAPCGVSGMQVWRSYTFTGVDITQQDMTWWNDYGTEVPMNNVSTAPRYIVIDQGCDAVAMVSRYRIVAIGFGVTANSIAYADDTFEVPVSGLNQFNSASQVELNGLLDGGVVTTFGLTPSQLSAFYMDDSGALCPGIGFGHTGYAQCEVNCAGYFRVMAWSYDNNCGPIYGPWSALDPSNVTITVNGVSHVLTCSP